MGPITRIKHYWNRFRLMINGDYYTEFIRKQGVPIGKNSKIIYPSHIDRRLPYLVEIGDHVTVSFNVTLLTHDATTAYAGDMVKVGHIVIRDHSFIGANSTILCNVSIGPNSIVGAGSVVSSDVPPNTVYAGNPARFVCELNEFIGKHRELGNRLPFFEAWHFGHPYIKDEQKQILRESLRSTPGYFCSRLPEDRGRG